MSHDINKIIDLYFSSPGDLDRADEFIAPEFEMHMPGMDLIRGVDGYRQIVSSYNVAFPDMKIRIEETIVEGDRAAVRWSVRGTNTGAFMGMPPTGACIVITGMDFLRFRDDRVVEDYSEFDQAGMLRQLGVGGESEKRVAA